MTKNKSVLFIGKRLEAIKTAVELGFETHVLSFKKPKFKSKNYSEILFTGNYDVIKGMSFDAIIPLTEKSIPIAKNIFDQLNSKKPDVQKYSLCHDKYEMKLHAQKHRIPISDFMLIGEETTPDDLIAKLGFPIVLKHRDRSGSRGLTTAEFKSELSLAQPNMLAEKYIEGKEYSVETLVKDGEIVFTNITDYFVHHTCNIVPANLSALEQSRLLKLNQEVTKAFGIMNGIAHAEYYLGKNQITFGEIAVRPPGGYIMKLIEQSYGFNPWEALLQIELGHVPTITKTPSAYSATWILHPGEGTLESEPDFSPLLTDPNLIDIQSGLKTGMIIKRREGSGEDFGRILLKSSDFAQLLSTIHKTRKCL